MNDKTKQPAKIERGSVVEVLDWSKDPMHPTKAKGTVLRVNADGTLDVQVEAEGVEPYQQSAISECTAAAMVPGQWRRLPEAAPIAAASAEVPK